MKEIQIWGKYPAVFLTGLLVTLLLTPLWRRVAPRLGFVDTPDARRIHLGPIPCAGGLAVFAGFHAACALIYLFPWLPFGGLLTMNWWLGFVAVSSCVVALGVLDDRFSLKPLTKIIGQVLVAVVAYRVGMRVGNAFGTPLPLALDVVATVVWFIILMNAFNLIDGMDGLAAGLGIVAAAGVGMSLAFRRHPGDVLMCLALAGACLGFLRHNFHPATVFLGDTGSMFIGCTIAALALGTSSKGTAMASIGVPLLAAGVPLLDAGLAVWRRSVRASVRKEGRSSAGLWGLATGDAEHLHHRLLRQGMSQRKVAVVLYLFGAFLSVAGVLSAVFRDYALGTLLVAFLVGTYVVVRHLAWIELWDSGAAVMQRLNRPSLRSRALLVYPVVDVLAMGIALAVVVGLTVPGSVHGSTLKHAWMKAAPLAVGFPFLLLVLSRAYSRVWSMARVSEYALAGGAVVTGVLGWMAVSLLTDTRGLRNLLVANFLYMGMAVTLIVGSRAFVRIVQDLMSWLSRPRADRAGVRRMLLVGAGSECLLFLKESSFLYDRATKIGIAGLIDEDAGLWGRWVHGHRVLGGLEQIDSILKSTNVDEIVILGKLDPVHGDRIIQAARPFGIVVRQWTTSLITLVPESEGAARGRL
jgi:UDP-N-acetylmuramyl pentapeptide phosphotransferase/UDP-N-acetylglucosamine-1-phosphate transferase